MSVKHIIFTCSMIITLVFLTGCGRYPNVDVQKAQKAVEEVKAVEGDRYLVEEFIALQDSLKIAIAELNMQKGKSVFKRDFSEGKQILQIVINKADTMKEKIGARKDELKAETEQIVIDYQATYDNVKKLISGISKNKKTKPVIERKQIELNAIQLGFEDVSNFFEKDDFASAKQAAVSAYTRIQVLEKELYQTVAKK